MCKYRHVIANIFATSKLQGSKMLYVSGVPASKLLYICNIMAHDIEMTL